MDFKELHMNATELQYSILGILWIIFTWQFYIEYRQYVLVKKSKNREDLNSTTLDKMGYATLFNLEKLQYSMLNSVYAIILSTIEIYFGFYYKYWTMAEKLSPFQNEIVKNCIWFHILYTVYSLLDTPYSVYESSITDDAKCNKIKSRPFFFNGDFISYATVQTLGVLFCTVIILLTRNCGNYIFLSIWLILVLIYLTCYNSYCPLIAQNFNTYLPLPDGQLRISIENLSKQLQFPLNGIYIINRANWFGYKNIEMVGVTRDKYIVINESLLPKDRSEEVHSEYSDFKLGNVLDKSDKEDDKGLLENEEILALTAHELGHWYHKHFYKLFTALLTYYITMFAVFAIAYQRDIIFSAFGFPENLRPILAGLFSVLSYIITPYNIVANFLLNTYSQHLEYEADLFSFNQGYGKQLKNAIKKLYSEKVIFSTMDPLYSKSKLDQPTLPERLKAIESLENNVETDMHGLIHANIKKSLKQINMGLKNKQNETICLFMQNVKQQEDKIQSLVVNSQELTEMNSENHDDTFVEKSDIEGTSENVFLDLKNHDITEKRQEKNKQKNKKESSTKKATYKSISERKEKMEISRRFDSHMSDQHDNLFKPESLKNLDSASKYFNIIPNEGIKKNKSQKSSTQSKTLDLKKISNLPIKKPGRTYDNIQTSSVVNKLSKKGKYSESIRPKTSYQLSRVKATEIQRPSTSSSDSKYSLRTSAIPIRQLAKNFPTLQSNKFVLEWKNLDHSTKSNII